MGRFPGAQPRGPRPGFAAEGPAPATSRSRANDRTSAGTRSLPSDRSTRVGLMSASASLGGSDLPPPAQCAQAPNGERKPDVTVLLGTVNLPSPARTGHSVLQIAGNLQHSQTGAKNVNGQPDLDAPTASQQ